MPRLPRRGGGKISSMGVVKRGPRAGRGKAGGPRAPRRDRGDRRTTAEATWTTRLDGQPARVKVTWAERRPRSLAFDLTVALRRRSSHKLRLSGSPHALHQFALLLGPAGGPAGGGAAGWREGGDGAGAGGAADEDGDAGAAAPPGRAFEAPGLQLELGFNLRAGLPLASATRRFGGSGGWRLRALRAALDGKPGAPLALSANGGCWRVALALPMDGAGALGLPRPRCWPKLTFTLTPDLGLPG
ncbi:hypothetical protein HT031_003586 [Scenedesmus sp. PABB004]|nr:hypothetical protein HT031_003586 [Scenedesmus sp. PABB004]